MRISSDVYYFSYQALVPSVCKYVKYLYYEQKSRSINVRTFFIRQNLEFSSSMLLVAHHSAGLLKLQLLKDSVEEQGLRDHPVRKWKWKQKIEPVPIPLHRASRNFPNVKTRNDFFFHNWTPDLSVLGCRWTGPRNFLRCQKLHFL